MQVDGGNPCKQCQTLHGYHLTMGIARHDPKIWTPAELDRLNSSHTDWVFRGSALFEAALLARDSTPRPDGTSTIHFGTRMSRMGSKEFSRGRLHRVAGMLFGMACECWCKTLWLASTAEAERVALSRSSAFRTHEIRDLLEKSGVDAHLTADSLEFADLLTSLIVGAGRFAGPGEVCNLIPWVDQAVDERSWTALQEGIGQRRSIVLGY